MKKGYFGKIEQLTRENTNFRHVLYSAPHCQLVLMSLAPGEDIGLETHKEGDQFFRFEKGEGKVVIDETEYTVGDGESIIAALVEAAKIGQGRDLSVDMQALLNQEGVELIGDTLLTAVDNADLPAISDIAEAMASLPGMQCGPETTAALRKAKEHFDGVSSPDAERFHAAFEQLGIGVE